VPVAIEPKMQVDHADHEEEVGGAGSESTVRRSCMLVLEPRNTAGALRRQLPIEHCGGKKKMSIRGHCVLL
jgi:hypothetical protein